jgi:uncharacterized protein
MDRNDRQAIEDLFEKLREVELRTPPRDAEAEEFIRRQVAAQPGAPYYMAQTIIVQEQALAAAQQRIKELEQQVVERPGILSGMFGGGQRTPSAPPGRYRTVPSHPHSGGQPGGFLAGAAQTALGVAGGVIIANLLTGAFSGSDAAAAESPAGADPDSNFDAGAFDTGTGDFDLGGDFGDF